MLIESRFSYSDIKEMPYREIKFWAERLIELKQKLMEDT